MQSKANVLLMFSVTATMTLAIGGLPAHATTFKPMCHTSPPPGGGAGGKGPEGGSNYAAGGGRPMMGGSGSDSYASGGGYATTNPSMGSGGGAGSPGGTVSTGGAPNMGGAPIMGGAPTTGGTVSTGGTPTTNGTVSNTGTVATGGSTTTGGLNNSDTVVSAGTDNGSDGMVPATMTKTQKANSVRYLVQALNSGGNAFSKSAQQKAVNDLNHAVAFMQKYPGSTCADANGKVKCTTADGRSKTYKNLSSQLAAKALALAKKDGTEANGDDAFANYLTANQSAVQVAQPAQIAFADAPTVILPASVDTSTSRAPASVSTGYNVGFQPAGSQR